MTPRLMHIYIYILLFLCKTSSIFLNIYNQMMFVLFDRTSRIAKPCSQKKSHEHGTNQSTHPSFMETCHQSGKSTIDFAENQPPTLGKSVTEIRRIGEICHRLWENDRHRLWENEPPILGKSVTDFGEFHSPILGKSVTKFREISHRLWGNQATDFGKLRH